MNLKYFEPAFWREFQDPPSGYLEEHGIDPSEEPGYRKAWLGVGKGLHRMNREVPVFFVVLELRMNENRFGYPIHISYFAHSWEDAYTFFMSPDDYGYAAEEDWAAMVDKTVWKTSWFKETPVKHLVGSGKAGFKPGKLVFPPKVTATSW